MLVAISTNENNLDSQVDLRFGRAKGFIIYNTDDNSSEYIDNIQNLEAAQGAGIQAAQNIVNANVEAVITGHCGPKAFRVLSTSGVKIYTIGEGKISEIIEKFKKGELQEATAADVEGHWV
ncbi:MAG: NifB/NifX family molybdenum-iron cluster-binding protein [Candidatus Gastranaerophilales bacterium]|nr:NifB/NifX family molybdenum-iron cluster-binding protein [Candidatus Gastranaerophilales bacterium]